MRLAVSDRSFNVHLNTSTCSIRLLDEIGQTMSYMGILVSSRITHETNTCEVVRETKKKVALRVKLLATEMSAIFSQQHKHRSQLYTE